MSEKRRASYLKQSDFERLEEWCRLVRKLVGSQPYLVGSALERPDYRDVDLRVILMDDKFDEQWPDAVKVRLMNRAVSIWGQQETGLPIDFQIQRMTEANAQFPGGSNRNPMGTRDWKRIPTQGVPAVDGDTGLWKVTLRAPDGQSVTADGHVANEAALEEFNAQGR